MDSSINMTISGGYRDLPFSTYEYLNVPDFCILQRFAMMYICNAFLFLLNFMQTPSIDTLWIKSPYMIHSFCSYVNDSGMKKDWWRLKSRLTALTMMATLIWENENQSKPILLV